MSVAPPLIRNFGRSDCETVWQSMKSFTEDRDAHTRDQFWLTEHDPVYTLGLNARREHLLDTGDIPLLQIDRGGQVTYHGPGQLVLYTLIDLDRLGLGVRDLVTAIERSIIALLADLSIAAEARPEAPGVYVGDAKIAALGLRVRKGRSYHGLSLNLDMDLTPFSGIDPCGYKGLAVTQLADLVDDYSLTAVREALCNHLIENLGYEERQ